MHRGKDFASIGDRACVPAFKLHHDIVWRIFGIIADMDADGGCGPDDWEFHPMNVLRSTSQVCQLWRNIILDSPSLWASVIDIDLLQRVAEEWWNEVLRRTGRALLCLKGRVSGTNTAFRIFAMNLLRTNWSRIRRLRLTVVARYLFERDSWTFLGNPAPYLESIQIRLGDWGDDELFLIGGSPIFSNVAPRLRVFEFPSTSATVFSPRAPWLSQLRSLSILSPFTASDVLEVLKNLPYIEVLDLENGIVKSTALVLPGAPITLPRLRRFRTVNKLDVCLYLLEHINPTPQCTFSLVVNGGSNLDLNDADRLNRALSRYMRNFFNSNIIKSMAINSTQRSFSLSVPLLRRFIPSMASLFFNIHASLPFPPYAMPAFLGSLLPCKLTVIDTLEFTPDYSFSPANDVGCIKAFLLSMTSVETLHLSKAVLKFLLAVSKEGPPVILPSLRTLKVTFIESTKSSSWDDLCSFFILRATSNAPMATLDIGEFRIQESRDWGDLENISGLKIIWKEGSTSGEYICCGGMSDSRNTF